MAVRYSTLLRWSSNPRETIAFAERTDVMLPSHWFCLTLLLQGLALAARSFLRAALSPTQVSMRRRWPRNEG